MSAASQPRSPLAARPAAPARRPTGAKRAPVASPRAPRALVASPRAARSASAAKRPPRTTPAADGGQASGKAQTLHRRIQADIERSILSGAWPPGHRIPFEHEIMARYGCARMTAHKAIAGLAEAGLIVRRRRAGSFVAEPRLHAVLLEIPDIQASVRARGQRYQVELLERRRRKPQRKRARELTLAGGGDLLELRCLHRADGRPFALEERLISLAAVPEVLRADFSVESPGSWLLKHVPWTEAEHRISAVNPTAEVAHQLGIAEHTACLALERQTWRGQRHITHVRQIFPGIHYELIARFTPNRSDPAADGG
jgi:GntR family transcriptional regulator, histidine utilization repressor